MLLGAWHSGIWSQVLLNIRANVKHPGFHAPLGFWEPAGRSRVGNSTAPQHRRGRLVPGVHEAPLVVPGDVVGGAVFYVAEGAQGPGETANRPGCTRPCRARSWSRPETLS